MTEYRVMVPLDGSRLAEHALGYLGPLQSLGLSRVRLVSAVEEVEDLPDLAEELLDKERNLLATYLRQLASEVEMRFGVTVETSVGRGLPGEFILEEAAAFAPDLLVISTHGRSGFSRWRFGSVADKVLRSATCNTLAVGPKASERESWLEARILPVFKSILVPLDGSRLSEAALSIADDCAQAFGAALHLVRAVPIPPAPSGLGGEAMYGPEVLEGLMSAARGYLEGIADGLKTNDIRIDVLVGPAAAQLEDYAGRNAIDLIVMTSHGRGGVARAVLGSITDRLIGGPAPVLVVRPS